MGGTEIPEFDTKDRQRVYEHIREEGPLPVEELADADVLPVRNDRARQLVAVLKRDGYIDETEGRLHDDYKPDESEQLEVSEVDVRVRQARLEDLTGLAGVIRQVVEGETYIVGESVTDQLGDADTLLHGDSTEPPTYFVALVEGEVIGWVHLESRDVAKLEGVLYLTMGLLDEYRGLGIGSQLLDRATTWASEYGYRKISSNVPALDESAIDFLETNGWAHEGIRPGHYTIEGEVVDEVLLSYQL